MNVIIAGKQKVWVTKSSVSILCCHHLSCELSHAIFFIANSPINVYAHVQVEIDWTWTFHQEPFIVPATSLACTEQLQLKLLRHSCSTRTLMQLDYQTGVIIDSPAKQASWVWGTGASHSHCWQFISMTTMYLHTDPLCGGVFRYESQQEYERSYSFIQQIH